MRTVCCRLMDDNGVSIPRTVVGGLQYNVVVLSQKAISLFQYRGRSWEGCNSLPCRKQGMERIRFNTEDGRGRAAILCP